MALMVLREPDGLPVIEVFGCLRGPGNALPPVLARLETLGHLSHSRDDGDGRVVHARPAPAGAALEHVAAAAQRRVACRTRLDEVSLSALRMQLAPLVDDMRAPAACDSPYEGAAP